MQLSKLQLIWLQLVLKSKELLVFIELELPQPQLAENIKQVLLIPLEQVLAVVQRLLAQELMQMAKLLEEVALVLQGIQEAPHQAQVHFLQPSQPKHFKGLHPFPPGLMHQLMQQQQLQSNCLDQSVWQYSDLKFVVLQTHEASYFWTFFDWKLEPN